jgi:hypothetical protein
MWSGRVSFALTTPEYTLRDRLLLIYECGFSSPPGLFQARPEQAIKAQGSRPALSGNAPNPVSIRNVSGHGRRKVSSPRTVKTPHDGRPRTAMNSRAGKVLRNFQHGVRLVVIDGQRPELLLLDSGKSRDLIPDFPFSMFRLNLTLTQPKMT